MWIKVWRREKEAGFSQDRAILFLGQGRNLWVFLNVNLFVLYESKSTRKSHFIVVNISGKKVSISISSINSPSLLKHSKPHGKQTRDPRPQSLPGNTFSARCQSCSPFHFSPTQDCAGNINTIASG